MVYLNGFGVEILVRGRNIDKFTRNGGKYYALHHGDEYEIRLTNNRDTIADAELKIDGVDSGKFRIPAHDTLTLERPANRPKKFTFVKEDSSLARRTGVVEGEYENGLISVKFFPKKEVKYEPLRPVMEEPVSMRVSPLESMRAAPLSSASSAGLMSSTSSMIQPRTMLAKQASMRAPEYSSGATILGDQSSQRFSLIEPLKPHEIDRENITTITIRLVAEEYRVYSPKTPYPPRIDDY